MKMTRTKYKRPVARLHSEWWKLNNYSKETMHRASGILPTISMYKTRYAIRITSIEIIP